VEGREGAPPRVKGPGSSARRPEGDLNPQHPCGHRHLNPAKWCPARTAGVRPMPLTCTFATWSCRLVSPNDGRCRVVGLQSGCRAPLARVRARTQPACGPDASRFPAIPPSPDAASTNVGLSRDGVSVRCSRSVHQVFCRIALSTEVQVSGMIRHPVSSFSGPGVPLFLAVVWVWAVSNAPITAFTIFGPTPADFDIPLCQADVRHLL
jgi:hypothetical protein